MAGDLRKMRVVKFPGEASERVARSLHDVGPGTAAELAERLGLTSTAVRRSLGELLEVGFVVDSDRKPFGPSPEPRRGRPARVFSLTSTGRAACAAAYDELALQALDFVARTQGEDGVRLFARERAQALLADVATTQSDPQTVAQALAARGYAAEVAESTPHAVQLCLHACPVAEAAARFPEICEAETEAMSSVLGVHVTRLATIAHGDGVCTAVIPTTQPNRRTG